ncbi:MAG: 3-phosphoshikimate 1-carboxyvinyltransferase [Phycisphaeraceae bacterium]
MSAALPDQIEIRPVEPFDARLRPPGSKSLTNRALLLAALAEGTSTLRHLLLADDTQRMLDALAALGFHLDRADDAHTARLTGAAGHVPGADVALDLGNAGTAMRFLAAACCLPPAEPVGHTLSTRRLDGIARMRQRPIGQLVDALRQLGASIDYLEQVGYPPLAVRATGLKGGDANALLLGPTLSSQYISALLLVGPYCDGGLTLRFDGPVTSQPYVRMTIELMRRFGADVEVDDAFTEVRVASGAYRALDYDIEPDASNANYFLAAAAVVPGSRCTIEGLGTPSLQGDVHFVEVLQRMGANVEMSDDTITVCAASNVLRGIDVSLGAMPDMAQTLAAVALFAEGPTTIRDIGNLRVKETDRLAAMQQELGKLGATVLIHGDSLRIDPPASGELRPATIDTYDDHRMAMSFAVVGLRAPGVTINDPGCVAKSFPDFFDYLERLRTTAGAAE